jgi:crotonobetainyl-CoA:carnitine CoA-transferase CaiB-like acyl-CoA transferase
MDGVLSGIRVLDFGRYIAGPYCATLLAEFGADVIRIEKRAGGEDRFQAPLTESQDGGLFMQMNRNNKRGMTLDPMTPAGRGWSAGWWRPPTWWSPTCRRRPWRR